MLLLTVTSASTTTSSSSFYKVSPAVAAAAPSRLRRPALNGSRRVVGPGCATPVWPGLKVTHSKPSSSSLRDYQRKFEGFKHTARRKKAGRLCHHCPAMRNANVVRAEGEVASAAAAAAAMSDGRKRVVIVGAGPAGLLLAHELLNRGDRFEVSVFDARGDPRAISEEKVRRYGLTLGERGRTAMEGVDGLWQAVIQKGSNAKHVVTHLAGGKTKVTPRSNSTLVDRVQLCATLLDELDARHNGKFTLHYNARCTQVDLQNHTVTFDTGASLTYDMLVGADGVYSAVREALKASSSDLNVNIRDTHAYWKTMQLAKEHRGGITDATHSFHFRSKSRKASTGLQEEARLAVLSQYGGSASLLMYYFTWSRPSEILDASPQELRDWFEHNFNAAVPTLEMCEEFLNDKSRPTLEVFCNRYHDVPGGVVLVGDAAHAMRSTMSLGCNTALQDVTCLVRLLDLHSDNLDHVLPAYSDQRVPEATAASRISYAAFPLGKLDMIPFIMYTVTTTFLHQLLPSVFPAPMFTLLRNPSLPCTDVWDKHRWFFGWCLERNERFVQDAVQRQKATQ